LSIEQPGGAGEFWLSVRVIFEGGKDVVDEYTKHTDNPMRRGRHRPA
jgi:hypothetical protein